MPGGEWEVEESYTCEGFVSWQLFNTHPYLIFTTGPLGREGNGGTGQDSHSARPQSREATGAIRLKHSVPLKNSSEPWGLREEAERSLRVRTPMVCFSFLCSPFGCPVSGSHGETWPLSEDWPQSALCRQGCLRFREVEFLWWGKINSPESLYWGIRPVRLSCAQWVRLPVQPDTGQGVSSWPGTWSQERSDLPRIPQQIMAELGSALGFSLPWFGSAHATRLLMVRDGTCRWMLAS